MPRSTRIPVVSLLLAASGFCSGTANAQFSSPMRDVENPDRFPYAEFASATINAPFVNGFINFPTPVGRRYFIEQVSVICTTPSNSDVFTQALLNVTKTVSATATTSFGSPVVALEKRGPGTFSGYVWSGSANVKVISDASASGVGGIFFNIFHSDFSSTVSCSATLFGHSLAL